MKTNSICEKEAKEETGSRKDYHKDIYNRLKGNRKLKQVYKNK
ncbi:unnamed protein product [Brassica napus]|uniref:(rape) hypothetical protein n=1 Tax=Brassica napus TaxID=3708 RepID=A0A816UI57_BRANA|nr:unnamed protein product [Brassica napus]